MIRFLLAIIICGYASAQEFLPISRLYYDIEAKAKTANYPIPDSIIVVEKGQNLRISWAHSIQKATAEDSAKQYDKSGGWVNIVRGLQDLTGGVVSHQDTISLSPGAWTLRIWAWYFAGSGVWNRSPAPSDEIELSVLEQTTEPPAVDIPTFPVIIEIKVE